MHVEIVLYIQFGMLTWSKNYCRMHSLNKYVTRFVKTGHNSAFIEIYLSHHHALGTKRFLL